MKSRNLTYYIVIIGWLLLSYTIFSFLDDNTIIALTKEDHFYENSGAISFLLASILFFATSRKTDKNLKLRKTLFILLGCFFLFGFLEEISWGQRIFNIATPQEFKDVNVQNEINIHNLAPFQGYDAEGKQKSFWALMLNFDRLFTIFWFTACFLLPLLYKLNAKLKNFLDKLSFPVVPLDIGVFFVINYLIATVLQSYINYPVLGHSLVEIKETAIAFLFFIVSVWFFKSSKSQ